MWIAFDSMNFMLPNSERTLITEEQTALEFNYDGKRGYTGHLPYGLMPNRTSDFEMVTDKSKNVYQYSLEWIDDLI